jgi:hypothetical protein
LPSIGFLSSSSGHVDIFNSLQLCLIGEYSIMATCGEVKTGFPQAAPCPHHFYFNSQPLNCFQPTLNNFLTIAVNSRKEI